MIATAVLLVIAVLLLALVVIWPLGDVHDELPSVTRIEVIDSSLGGRVYSKRPAKVAISFQDGGRTLKVFVTSRGPVA